MDFSHLQGNRRYAVALSALCVLGWFLYFTTIMNTDSVLSRVSQWRLHWRFRGDDGQVDVTSPSSSSSIITTRTISPSSSTTSKISFPSKTPTTPTVSPSIPTTVNSTFLISTITTTAATSTNSPKGQQKVVILMWTRYFFRDALGHGGIGYQNISKWKCFEGCEIVTDRSALNHSDAVLFHAFDFKKSDMPPARKRAQLWIFLQQESPAFTRKDLDIFSGVFNWTMTYRRDSDVFHPYGKMDHLPEEEADGPKIKAQIDSLLSKKSKLVAGVISRCVSPSHREVLVSQLRAANIPVDIYGKCGLPSGCPHSVKPRNCSESDFWSNLTSTYKFYLSFENSLCVDYVTEKFFRTLELGLVPVVFGGANYSLIAPPASFIDARVFNTSEKLAKFLIKLDKDPKEYRKYFQWRFKYVVTEGYGFCNLCNKLKMQKNSPEDAQSQKVYSNLNDWWFKTHPVGNSSSSSGKNATTAMQDACSKPNL